MLPNFLVIGAGRAGTTSLHHYLRQHPDVFLPEVKSPSHFFCRGRPEPEDPYLRTVTRNYFVPDPGDYEALFDGVRAERAVGEVSPVYLASVHVAARIAERLAAPRLIAILRHPVDRVYARFVGRVRDGLERRDGFAAVVAEERRHPLVQEDAFGTYLAAGCCSHFLQTYFDRFPRDHIRIHLFEDFQRDTAAVVRDLFGFLGVDTGFVPDLGRRHNVSGGRIASRPLRLAWTKSALVRARLRKYLPVEVRDRAFALVTRRLVDEPLDPALRWELTELYRDDIDRLQQLIGRDLSSWLEPAEAQGGGRTGGARGRATGERP